MDDWTLDSLKGKKPNDYERGFKFCGDFVANYHYDQLFPVYGFRAIINSSKDKEALMCFNINFEDNSDIFTIDKILKIYLEWR